MHGSEGCCVRLVGCIALSVFYTGTLVNRIVLFYLAPAILFFSRGADLFHLLQQLAKSSLDASHHCTDAAATSQPRSRRPNGGDTGDLTESRPRYATLPPVLTGGTACLRSRANVARPHTHGLHTGTVALTRPPLKNIGSTVRFDAPPRSLMMTDEESDVCVCIRHPLPV